MRGRQLGVPLRVDPLEVGPQHDLQVPALFALTLPPLDQLRKLGLQALNLFLQLLKIKTKQ